MALQGNLRDFSASEILQLVGSQKKSGSLTFEWNTEQATVWVQEGRIVSTRLVGAAKDDPLLAFLCATHRLSEEQVHGLLTIQRESGRDIEDLLVNGRYLDEQELAGFVERQVLEDVTRLVRWDNGTYRFDPNTKWTQAPIVMLSMEGVIMEAARRLDEQKRFVALFRDPNQLLGVRDLPDPDEPLSEEERDLFGIIDGRHTIAEVLEAAPLSEYECYEALFRMIDAHWIEFVGHQRPGSAVTPGPAPIAPPKAAPNPLPRELAVALTVIVALVALRWAGGHVATFLRPVPAHDVVAAAQVRDLEYALDLYARENGHYPEHLDALVVDRWVAADQLRPAGYTLAYHADVARAHYQLRIGADR